MAMSVRLKHIHILWALFVTLAFAGCKQATTEELLSVTIVHINDIHGHVGPGDDGVGGFPRIASTLHELREKDPNLIFLMSGDLITGSPLSSLTRGETIFRLANRLNITAFVPGNHEFDYGVSQYKTFMKIAEFPFIAANMRFDVPPLASQAVAPIADAPYIILNAGGTRIGVIGIAHPDTPWLTIPENTQGVTFEKPAPVLKSLVPKVWGEAQLIVALTHIGIEEDRKLAREVSGINLIIGGHSHDRLDTPEKIGNTWIAQAGHSGRFIGVINLKISKSSKQVVSLKGRLIHMGPDRPGDLGLASEIDAEEARLPIRPDAPIGRASRSLNSDADLAPWIASLMKKHMGADIGLVNKGGVRSDLRPGPITYRDIFNVMPFDNRVVLALIPGIRIQEWLDNDSIILDKPVKTDPNKIYRVGTMDFVASLHRIPPQNVHKTDTFVRDLMIEDIKSRGVLP